MECNKEEAIRARSIAEKRMQCKDFVGAQKFALKAQQLFPDLENISQMLTVCEIHCAAETKVGGSEDWYGILQVESTADEALIRKQYRKLALLLHPDKNKFAGAEAAFKLVGEAHRTLSDKGTRSLYDMKRKATLPSTERRPPPHQPNMSSNAWKQPTASNTYQSNASTPLTQQQAQTANAAQTFWTLCPSCGTRYQYYRSIMNKALRCQNCMNPYIAYDLNAQGARPTPAAPNSGPGVGLKNVFSGGLGNKDKENSQVENGIRKEQEVKFEKVKFEQVNKRKPVVQSTDNPRSKQRRKVVEESSDTDNTDSEDISLEESEGADSSDTDSTDSEGNIIEESKHAAPQDAEMRGRSSRRSTRQKHNISYNEESNSDNDSENLTSSQQLRRKLHKSDTKLSEDDVDEVEVPSHAASPKSKLNDRNRGSTSLDKDKLTGSTLTKKCTEVSGDMNVKDGSEGRSKDGRSFDSSTDKPRCGTLSYPDPEFHDFDEDRGKKCFAVDQIWALYDDLDAMPRFYARIKSVSSTRFMVRFTWLEYRPVRQAEKYWFDKELPIGCGNFRHGNTESTEDIQLFSHIMPANRDSKGNSYGIYPRKGEVWALFKDWDIKWSSNSDRHRQYNYEFVEILSDFASDAGVHVRRLVKVKGYVSLFCSGGREATLILHIPPSELLRFSHMVPSYRMSGKERKGIPEGSYELDPASLPTNFQETLVSVALDEVEAQEEHGGLVNGTQCVNSSTMEKKSTEGSGKSFTVEDKEEGNEKVGIEKTLDGTDAFANMPKHTCERRNSQASGSYSDTAAAESNMVNNEAGHLDTPSDVGGNVMENGNGSMSNPCPTAPQISDSEFYDFYLERSKGKFQAGQIWALYCEHDDFPKYYAMVKKVSSEDFKVHITWLEGIAVSKQEKIWFDNDLPFASGRFVSSSGDEADEAYDVTDYFSHMVQAEPVGKGQYQIFPQVGQVWAVYKKWNVEWKITDMNECAEKGEYEVVEVISSNASMFVVTILEKVDGFKAVFKSRKKNGGVSTTMAIPRSEHLRFSHQIPSFRLTREAGGKLCGYWNLDTASLPHILIDTNSR